MASTNYHWNHSYTKPKATACQFTTFFAVRLSMTDHDTRDDLSLMLKDKQHAVDLVEAIIEAIENHDYYSESHDMVDEEETSQEPLESIGLTD